MTNSNTIDYSWSSFPNQFPEPFSSFINQDIISLKTKATTIKQNTFFGQYNFNYKDKNYEIKNSAQFNFNIQNKHLFFSKIRNNFFHFHYNRRDPQQKIFSPLNSYAFYSSVDFTKKNQKKAEFLAGIAQKNDNFTNEDLIQLTRKYQQNQEWVYQHRNLYKKDKFKIAGQGAYSLTRTIFVKRSIYLGYFVNPYSVLLKGRYDWDPTLKHKARGNNYSNTMSIIGLKSNQNSQYGIKIQVDLIQQKLSELSFLTQQNIEILKTTIKGKIDNNFNISLLLKKTFNNLGFSLGGDFQMLGKQAGIKHLGFQLELDI